MALLDLPPEIFKRILSDTIASVGYGGAWKLRKVCCKYCLHCGIRSILTDWVGTFDQEITAHVLSALPREAFELSVAKRILSKNLAYYLTHRVFSPYDVRPELPNKVVQMVQYINAKLAAKIVRQEWNILVQLCDGLLTIMKQSLAGDKHVLRLLWEPSNTNWTWSRG
jgi:hypothetical protein